MDSEPQASDPLDSVLNSDAPIDLPVQDDRPTFTYRASGGRMICVHYLDRAVEFKLWRFNTSFVKSEVIESYVCPVEELKAFEYFMGSGSQGAFRFWTTRGYLRISGYAGELGRLARAVKCIAGTRRPPLMHQTWLIIAIACLVAILVCAAAIHFKLI